MTLLGLFRWLATKHAILKIKPMLGYWQAVPRWPCKCTLSNHRDSVAVTNTPPWLQKASEDSWKFVSWHKIEWTEGTVHELAVSSKMPLSAWWHFTKQSYLISFATAYSCLHGPFLGFSSEQRWCLKKSWIHRLFFFLHQQPFHSYRKSLLCKSLNLKPKLRASPCNHGMGHVGALSCSFGDK